MSYDPFFRIGVRRALKRQDQAIRTMAWWLVQAQTGFGQTDARGIEDILDGKQASPPTPTRTSEAK